MSPKEMAMNHPKCLNQIPLPKLFFFSQLIKLCVDVKNYNTCGEGWRPDLSSYFNIFHHHQVWTFVRAPVALVLSF